MEKLIIRTISSCYDCPKLCNEKINKLACCNRYPDIKELTKGEAEKIPEWCPLPDA